MKKEKYFTMVGVVSAITREIQPLITVKGLITGEGCIPLNEETNEDFRDFAPGVFGYFPELEKIVGKKVKIIYKCSAEIIEIDETP